MEEFFASIKDWKKNPHKYKSRPKLPKYLDKVEGRFVTIYTKQRVSTPKLKEGKICLSKTNIVINTKIPANSLQCVRLVPRKDHYVVEVVYNKEVDLTQEKLDGYVGIDVGLGNLAVLAGNSSPVIINGKPLKSMNQFYNKEKARLQKLLPEKQRKSKRITRLTNKRNRKVNDYLHKASRKIINICLTNKVGNIVIGKNKNWKQEINIGKRNNQNFVQIPFDKLISMIRYKAELVGIKVVIREESYTSKCSFLDNESIEKHEIYMGSRIKRGLFKSRLGMLINADVNGALNILRKEVPRFNVLNEGIEGFVVNPEVLTC